MGTASKLLLGAMAIGAAGAVWHFGCRQSAAEAAQQRALSYVPADAELVMGFDFQQLKSSPAWDSVAKRLESDPAYRAMNRACGVDLLASIPRITIAIRDIEDTKPDGVFVLQGKDLDKLTTCIARDDDFQRSGESWIVKDGGNTAVIRMVGDDTLVGVFGGDAKPAVLDEVIARTPRSITSVDSFTSLYRQVEVDSTAWFVVKTTRLLDRAPLPIRSYVPRAIGGSLDLGATVSGKLVARFESAAEAERVLDEARPFLRYAIDAGVNVERDGADLEIGVELSAEKTRELLRDLSLDW